MAFVIITVSAQDVSLMANAARDDTVVVKTALVT